MTRYSGRTTVEECLSIAAETFTGEGDGDGDLETIATEGVITGLIWYRGEGEDREDVASIVVVGKPGEGRLHTDDAIDLVFSYTDPDGERQQVAEQVDVTYTEPHFGGRRAWFRCPECYDRVGTLHARRRGSNPLFFCRECQDLTYKSSQEQDSGFMKHLGKSQDRLDEAQAALDDGPITREKLREVYEAKKDVEAGSVALLKSIPNPGSDGEDEWFRRSRWERLPDTFDEWLAEVFPNPERRDYGVYGRCEATARSTGDRCLQPATGEHGKCCYHGGAPGTGVGEGQVDRQAEATREHIQQCVDPRVDTWALRGDNHREVDKHTPLGRGTTPLCVGGGNNS